MDEFDDLVERAREEAMDPSLKVSWHVMNGFPKLGLT